MAWTSTGSILLTSDWQYTQPIAVGLFFRLKHTEAPNGGLFVIAQCEIDADGKLSLIDSQVMAVEQGITDVIKFSNPGCFSERRIAIKKLPKQPSLQQEIKRLFLPGYLQPTDEEIRIVSRSNWAIEIEISNFVEPTPPTTATSSGTGTTTPPSTTTTAKTLAYTSDGDTNGVCYWIGTNYGALSWTNPHTDGLLTVSLSSPGGSAEQSDPAGLVNRLDSDNSTGNQFNAWMKLDLGSTNSLVCNYYSLKGRNFPGEQIRSWKFQGSNDDTNWATLDVQSNNAAITQNAWFSAPVNISNSYRYFRILQAGANSNGSNYLTLGEFEFYGTLTHTI